MVLSPNLSGNSYDYAIGAQAGAVWFTAPQYLWYPLNGNPIMTLDSTGLSTPGGATISGNANIGGTLSAGVVQAENLRSYGDTYIGHTIFVTADVSIGGAVGAGGNGSIGGSFGVAGALNVGGTANIVGQLNLTNGLDISGTVSGGGGNALYVNGSGLFTNNIQVQGLNSQFSQGLVVTAASGHLVALQINGDLEVFGDAFSNSWQINSDARLKTEVADYSRGLDAVRKLRPVGYRIGSSGVRHHGLIANDVAAIVPEAVNERRGQKTIDPMALIAVLINTVRELSEKMEMLESRYGE